MEVGLQTRRSAIHAGERLDAIMGEENGNGVGGTQ